MREPTTEPSVRAWIPTEAETIALAYYRAHRRDGWAALVHAIEDALRDLDATGAVIRQQGREISRGYVRGGPPA